MKLIRVRNPIGVDYIKNSLLEDSAYDNEDLVASIKYMMEQSPEEVFLLQGWEGKELAGFLLAYNDNRQRHVFLHQVWIDARFPGLPDKMFFRLLVWADNLGKCEIRAETSRDALALEKRWNFKEIAKIISFEIPEDFESLLLEGSHASLIGDKKNGIELKNKDGVNTVETPTTGGEGAQQGHPEGPSSLPADGSSEGRGGTPRSGGLPQEGPNSDDAVVSDVHGAAD